MISCCCFVSDLVVFGLNVALKTDLSKNFQETKTEKSSQDVLSLKMCWECRVLILLWLLNPSMSRWKIRLVVGLSALIWRGGEGLSWFIVSIQIKKWNKKPFFFFFNAFLMSIVKPGNITSAIQTVCLSLVQSCGIQRTLFKSQVFSVTKVCLSQNSSKYSWNTFPLFIQL